VVYYIIAISICLLDQFSKFCVEKFFHQTSGMPVISGVFHVTLVHNTGIAFGMFKEHPSIFAALSLLAIILIIYFLNWKKNALSVLEKTALCFILGGTCGNFIDRVRHGYIVDFIDFRVWPVFNIADSFITIGAAILIISILFKKKEA